MTNEVDVGPWRVVELPDPDGTILLYEQAGAVATRSLTVKASEREVAEGIARDLNAKAPRTPQAQEAGPWTAVERRRHDLTCGWNTELTAPDGMTYTLCHHHDGLDLAARLSALEARATALETALRWAMSYVNYCADTMTAEPGIAADDFMQGQARARAVLNPPSQAVAGGQDEGG